MFDLNKAINEWRQQMLAAGIKSPVPFEELESHLRDDVEQQMRGGSSAEQAFALAVNRIGQAPALKAEFDHARHCLQASRKRKILLSFTLLFAGLVLCLSAITFFETGMSFGQQLLALMAVVLTISGAFGWRYALRFIPIISNKVLRLQAGLGLLVLAFCYVNAFNYIVLPRIFGISEQLGLMALFWGFFPGAILGCLGIGIAMSERERRQNGMDLPMLRQRTKPS